MMPEEWIVATTFANGEAAFYGENRARVVGRTPYRGNAYRFASEGEALGAGYHAKDAGLIGEFTVQKMPPKPRFKTGEPS
jgi:hypothetical protein